MNKKIRYAVVGLGHTSQTAVLPAFKHAGSAFGAYQISRDTTTSDLGISRLHSVMRIPVKR